MSIHAEMNNECFGMSWMLVKRMEVERSEIRNTSVTLVLSATAKEERGRQSLTDVTLCYG